MLSPGILAAQCRTDHMVMHDGAVCRKVLKAQDTCHWHAQHCDLAAMAESATMAEPAIIAMWLNLAFQPI